MNWHFDPSQDYQRDAIDAVVDTLKDLPPARLPSLGDTDLGFDAIPNRLEITSDQLLHAAREVQERNGLTVSQELGLLTGTASTPVGDAEVSVANLSIEMETGTGKTYVYLRTALELADRYGVRKFIIVSPSVAIREGILKTLQITREHFRSLYPNVPYRFQVYDSSLPAQVSQFAQSSSLELLVMTIDSFNKDRNLLLQPSERLQGNKPLHLIQATRPVLVLDEPQKMESENRIRALVNLNPSLMLRYSATHKNPHTLLYRLSPAAAYDRGLVKKIEVASVVREDVLDQPFIRLLEVARRARTLTASVEVHKQSRTGTVSAKVVKLRAGERLDQKTGRAEYAGYDVEEISDSYIRFLNGTEVQLGEDTGSDRVAIFDAQVRYTIEEHFRKQRRLKPFGVKVLSLFFVDRVADYAGEEALVREQFDRAFADLKVEYPEWKDRDPSSARSAYFAQIRRRTGEVELLDSTDGQGDHDKAAYDLIMKDKERLLSFDEPTAFVFSHSALGEGWDSPNVFQICTLRQTVSESKKRQEIGRGMRLAVDQDLQRIAEPNVNILTVVANESYERYVESLQTEYAADDDTTGDGAPPKPADARKRVRVRLSKARLADPEFERLWSMVARRTRYSLRINSGALERDVVPKLAAVRVARPRIAARKTRIAVNSEEAFEALQMSASRSVADLAGRYPLPNLLDLILHLMQETSPPIRLTRKTVLACLKGAADNDAMALNPEDFARQAVKIFRESLMDQLVGGIKYEPTGDVYEVSQFAEEFEAWANNVVPCTKSPYDGVVYDSDGERNFAECLERLKPVTCYVKLPSWFLVPTPLGNYNPDWAIVWRDVDEHGEPTGKPTLYLVRETKFPTEDLSVLRPGERRKILCAQDHFGGALKVDYAVRSSPDRLP